MVSYWIYSKHQIGIMIVLVTLCVFLYNRLNLNLAVSIDMSNICLPGKGLSPPLAFWDIEAYKASSGATNPGN